ncbi:MAG: hypothetical protein R3A10_08885 [Caldilineaceae bacterium]
MRRACWRPPRLRGIEPALDEAIQFVEADTGLVAGALRRGRLASMCWCTIRVNSSSTTAQLARCTDQTLVMTYAPQQPARRHALGGRLLSQSKRRTEIQMIRRSVVVDTLAGTGLTVARTVNIQQGLLSRDAVGSSALVAGALATARPDDRTTAGRTGQDQIYALPLHHHGRQPWRGAG